MRGRTNAFEERVANTEADLLRYLQRRLLNAEDAADAFSETLLAAWRQRRKMPSDHEEARMWLFGIARNVLRSTRRSGARRSAATQLLADAIRTGATDPADHTAVHDAIGSLPDEQAELVRLTYWDGFTSAEAGTLLGISASAARSRLALARAALRQQLQDEASDASSGAAAP